MADRYWVGGTGSWTAASSAHWATASNGAGGASVPVATDDVHIDANSGSGTITMNTASIAQSIDFTGYTGTISCTGLAPIGGAVDGPAGLWVKFSSTMSFTGASGLRCVSTTGNATLNMGGATAFPLQLNVSTASSYLKIPTGASITGNVTHSIGTIEIATGSVTFVNFVQGAGTKTLTLTGDLVVTGAFTGSSTTISGAGKVHLRSTSSVVTHTMTGVYTGTAGWLVVEPADNQQIVAGNANTFTPNSISFDMSVQSAKIARFDWSISFTTGTLGSVTFVTNAGQQLIWNMGGFTVKVAAGAPTGFSNVTFVGAGAVSGGTWTGGTNIGVVNGPTTGVTSSTGATQYRVGSSGSGSQFNGTDANKWASSSGGTGGTGRAPLPQDSIVFDASSGSGTVTLNAWYSCTNLTITSGCTVTVDPSASIPGFSVVAASLTLVTLLGNLIVDRSMGKTGPLALATASATARCTDGPSLYSLGTNPLHTLSGSSKFQAYSATAATAGNTALDMSGFNLELDPTATQSFAINTASSASFVGNLIVGSGELKLHVGTSGPGFCGAGTGSVNATSTGRIVFASSGTWNQSSGVKATAGSNFLIMSGCSVNLANTSVNSSIGTVTLDGTASLTTSSLVASYLVTSLLATNQSSGSHGSILASIPGSQASLKFTNAPSLDFVSVTDHVADGTGAIPAVTRNGTKSNTTNWVTQWSNTFGELLGVTDTSRLQTEGRPITDSLGILDSQTALESFLRNVADTVGITEVRVLTDSRVISEVVGLLDSKGASSSRTVTDLSGILDSHALGGGLGAVVSDQIGLLDSLAETKAQAVVIVNPMGIHDALGLAKSMVVVDGLALRDFIHDGTYRTWIPKIIFF